MRRGMPWSQTVMAAITGTLAWLSFLMSSVGCRSSLCPSSCSCLGALVDCSKRGLIDVPKDLPYWVEILDLQKNDLTTISDKAFENLDFLWKLDLSHNQIRNLNKAGFNYLTGLRNLNVEHNHLSDIPDLGLLPNLEKLLLSNNEIFTINGTTLGNYPNLKHLDASGNRIVDVSSGTFPNGTKLVYLGLNNNRIVSLEKGCLNNLTSLEILKLERNRLTEIVKNQFQNLTSLKQLDLNRNRLRHIEGLAFHGLVSLAILKLKLNNITTLPDGAFYGLGKMHTLHMEHNNISKIEKGWIYGLSGLRHLFLSHNSISEIVGGWEFCKRLKILDLRHNELQSIHKYMFNNNNDNMLKKLHLSNNLISYIEEGSFETLKYLQVLELDNNEISVTIEDSNGAFRGMERLKYLNLAQNNVKSVGKRAFLGLPRLQILNLTSNPITSIQENAFSVLEKLEELRFNSSNLLCDCSLDWFPTWLIANGFQHSVVAKCNHPEWLKGKSVFEANTSNFTCDDSPKPRLTQHPRTQIALKDANLTLVCRASSTSASVVSFQWRKNNTLLLDAETENFATEDVKHSVTNYVSLLHIRSTDSRDEGHYQCVISNQFGSVYSQKAHITVHEFPYFSKTPVDITVNVSSTAKLECAAQGSPKPEVSWKKDGGDDFPAARERRMHVMPADHAFFIVDVKASDMGVYSCTAHNDVGTIIVNATLTVSETPSFVKPMQNKEIRAGETAVLECLASGSPRPNLTWTKDGGPLIPTDRHFFTADNQLLIIVQTQMSDTGDYTCEMSNSLGTEKDSSYLKIYRPLAEKSSGLQDDSTATGIIVIAVVCCVVGTSLVWVIIIYQTRKRAEEYAPTDTDDAALPGELAPFATYTAGCTEECKGSAPHLFMDSNSEHSSKDSGTGDSAKRSSDELLPAEGVKHHSLIILNDRSHLTRIVRGSSLGSVIGAQSDISDDAGHSCPSTCTTTHSPGGTPQQHTPLLHAIHNGKNTKRKTFHCGMEESASTDGDTNDYTAVPANEPSRWPEGSPCRSFSAEQLSNKKTGKLIYPRIAYIQAPNSSDERLNILCGSESLERDSGVSTFAHSSSPASTRSWSTGSLRVQRLPSACQGDNDSLSGRSGDFQFADHSTDNSSTLSLNKPSENCVVPKTYVKKPTPVQRVAAECNIPASHTGVV